MGPFEMATIKQFLDQMCDDCQIRDWIGNITLLIYSMWLTMKMICQWWLSNIDLICYS